MAAWEQKMSKKKTSKPIKEWFADTFVEGEIPDEVIHGFEEDLADTAEDLLFVTSDDIEGLMQSLALKPKIKGKIRRAIKALEDEQEQKKEAAKVAAAVETIKATTNKVPTAAVVTPDRPAKSMLVQDTRSDVAAMKHTPTYGTPAVTVEEDTPPSARSIPQDIPKQPGAFLVPTIRKDQISGPWKTIMVVGETGCGKSTTLNSMVNHLWDVDIKDHYRLVLVPPPSSAAAQAHSVTSEVTAYHLRPPKLMHGLTIIDTPGFGDTKGLEADKMLVEKIEHSFRREIDTLDGIFFIVRSSGRLDLHMKYVFNSVLRLFGNDLVRNLFLLVTFADGAEPPVLASIRAAEIPAQEIFELNNSAFFNGFDTDKAMPLSPHICMRKGDPKPHFPVPQGIVDRPHTAMFWQLGNLAMGRLFDALSKTQPVSLQLSIDTLKLRKKLQLKIIHLQQQVSNGLNKISNMRQNIDTIKRNAKEINASKDFVIKGKKDELYKESTPGQNNTTCTNCKHTCHAGCAFDKNEDKVNCIAIDGEDCNVCTGKCHWTAHVNDDFVLQTRQIETTVVRDEIKKKFDKSTADLSFAEQAVIAISKEISEEQQNVKISIDELRSAISELNNIAMRPSVMEEEDYYDKLIQTEEAQRTPGWKDRVIALKELKDQARTLKQVTDYDDAGVVIFKSAMDQVNKDLADIRAILGKGVDASAAGKLKNVEKALSQSTTFTAGGTTRKSRKGRFAPTKTS